MVRRGTVLLWFSSVAARGSVRCGASTLAVDAAVVDASVLRKGDDVEIELDEGGRIARVSVIGPAPPRPAADEDAHRLLAQ